MQIMIANSKMICYTLESRQKHLYGSEILLDTHNDISIIFVNGGKLSIKWR